MTEMNCWKCGIKLSVTPELAGQEAQCPGCGARNRVPHELFSQQPVLVSPPVAAIPLQQSAPLSFASARTGPTFPILTASIVLSAIGFVFNLGSDLAINAIAFLLAFSFMLLAQCTWLLFHQRLWSLVPPNERLITPAKAAWFMMIPFYNYYWVFKTCIPLQDHLNRRLDERQITAIRASTGLAVAFSLLFVAAPVLDLIGGLIGGPAGGFAATFFIGGAEFVVWLLMVLNQKQVARQILLNPVQQAAPEQILTQV